jgi:hypothetical protein
MYVLVVVLNPAQPERFSQLLGGGEFPGLRPSWGRLDSWAGRNGGRLQNEEVTADSFAALRQWVRISASPSHEVREVL